MFTLLGTDNVEDSYLLIAAAGSAEVLRVPIPAMLFLSS